MHLNNMNKLLLATTTIWLILINMSSMCHGSILRQTDNTTLRSFPADFLWGVGSSAYQVEGGWNADDKGQSILEQYGHNDTTDYNADITADSYHQWRRDVQMVRELNVKVYRFSISWPRIMPNGRMNYVSTAGIKYYNDLIDELLLYNITPAVTIYHWDLPILLQQFGGWTNPEIIPLFTDYARLLFETFGDRVKLWTTMNEPYIFCEIGYGSALLPPGTTNQGIGGYMCGHNVLKAHADAYHMYVDEFKPTQNGQIGIVFVAPGAIPKTDTPEDREATDRTLQFLVGWFAHPIFSQQGNYPQVMIDRIGNLSAEQGFKNSRLPTFTQAEIEHIRGTSDFFGINTYTSNVMSNDYNNSNNNPVPSFLHDIGTTQGFDDSWPVSGSFWIRSYPPGMYSLLMWIDKEYNHPAIIVMENGVSGRGALTDYFRVDYINSYLLAVLDAMEAGANVIGYFIWSLMDSYEWTSGYVEKYGLYHVDFTHPDRTRTPKASALAYARTCKTGQIDVNYYPVVTELVQPSLPSKPSSATQFSSQFSVVAVSLLTLLTRIVMQ